MKNLGIALLLWTALVLFSLSVDVFLGFGFTTSLRNAFNPFLVMDIAEMVIFAVFIFFLVVVPLVSFFRKKMKEQD
ncbi:hypothetical protein BTO30_15075 [Domibacillus antri]|uniref:Uncharacterized protein n=1 Tax=Domibacillus antri TaxID=1714264 RepID=A0A1Q8Q265_9BACI|nr:hypothetical protein [Domibacillus antri]OLN21436.1 hypothetical protein BTO30_15075 [Domibacillus antri]